MTTDDGAEVSRRGFMRAGALAAGTAAAGTAAGQESPGGGAEPEWGGWLDGVDGGFQDARGQGEVTVAVGADGNGGAFAFGPAGLWVDPGTTVKWEWTGEGGAHNVTNQASEGTLPEDQTGPAQLDSGSPVSDPGIHYEHTFGEGETGISRYYCAPHVDLGMKGAVAVGGDVATVVPEQGGGVLPDSAKALGVAGAAAMASTLGLAYLFIKYGGRTSAAEG